MKNWVYKKTLKTRHSIVKMIAPKVFEESKHSPSYLPRPMVTFLRKRFGRKRLSGVEIGVRYGKHAESILETLKIEKLFLVDPYIPYIETGLLITSCVDGFSLAKERLSKFGDKIVFIFKTSMDALDDIPDNLDFVYIDGNHSYSFVKDDIEKYYGKIKVGGVLGGHDFETRFLGVIKAVTEFAYANKLEFDAKTVDWWLIKK